MANSTVDAVAEIHQLTLCRLDSIDIAEDAVSDLIAGTAAFLPGREIYQRFNSLWRPFRA
jgi:hypothetical protein